MLLVVVALVAIFPGRMLYQAERQRRAIAHILALGGRIDYEHQYDERGWSPNAPPPGPQWLVELFGIDLVARVKIVGVYGGNRDITDDDLLVLDALSHAEQLQIGTSKHDSDRVSDDGLSAIRHFRNLRSLTLGRLSGTTDECLAHLRPLRNLNRFKAFDVPWAGSGCAHLTDLPLEDVNFQCSVSDECLVHVGRIPTLKVLYLEKTGITDDGLAHLTQLHNLEELHLGSTQIGDEGVKHLYGLKKLRHLHIFKTKLTVASVEGLANELPQCHIDASFGTHYRGEGWKFWKDENEKEAK